MQQNQAEARIVPSEIQGPAAWSTGIVHSTLVNGAPSWATRSAFAQDKSRGSLFRCTPCAPE